MEFTEEEEVPNFVRHYIDALNYEGYPDFIGVSREYKKAKDEYHSVLHPSRANQVNMHNLYTGDNREVKSDPYLTDLEDRYKNKALEIAKKHGYVEPEKEEPKTKNQEQAKEAKASELSSAPSQIPSVPPSDRASKIAAFKAAQQQVTEANKQRGNEIERD